MSAPTRSRQFVPAALQPATSLSDPEMTFDVDYPDTLSRWKVLIKWILVIPHLAIFALLAPVFFAVVVVAWISILFTGRFPRTLWNFELEYMRRSANQTSYAFTLQCDDYPPFGASAYPATLDLAYAEHLNRWKVLVKWLLMIPNLLALGVVMIGALIAVVAAFGSILVTGRYPHRLFDYVTGAFRWGHRWGAYVYLMTDRYPPFRLGP